MYRQVKESIRIRCGFVCDLANDVPIDLKCNPVKPYQAQVNCNFQSS